MVLTQAGGMAGAGIGIGSVLCIAAGRALSRGFGPQAIPLDPVWFTGAALALLAITLLAAAIPGRYASKIDPQRALRQE
jgi:ABC-type antimicrobial peptide transport system permease subunit